MHGLRRVMSAATLTALAMGVVPASRAQCVLPNQLGNGSIADATQVMANFNALAACIGALPPAGSTNSIQYKAGTGALGGVGPLTDGQLVIGATGSPPQAATLTAGAGISIGYGVSGITIATSGASMGDGLYRQVMSATPTSSGVGLTNWLNQGTSTVADAAAGITLNVPPSGATVANVTARTMAAPSTPYAIRTLIAATRSSNSSNAVGIGWYDGTNKLHLVTLTTANGAVPILEVTKWNSPTSYNAADFTSFGNGFPQPIWLEVRDDGTNVAFAFSQDGANYLTVFTVAKASGFLGATGYSNLVFAVNPRGTSQTIGTILSWTQL
jgi:hypothetical protein